MAVVAVLLLGVAAFCLIVSVGSAAAAGSGLPFAGPATVAGVPAGLLALVRRRTHDLLGPPTMPRRSSGSGRCFTGSVP
ncbi:hypothetical protein GCM10027610_054900 [Dactylosporangium cerinum]